MSEIGSRPQTQDEIDGSPALIKEEFIEIKFQSGARKEAGENGTQLLDILVIVAERLEGFQKGKFRCRENAIALTRVQEAMLWLNARTSAREQKDIEGTNVNHE